MENKNSKSAAKYGKKSKKAISGDGSLVHVIAYKYRNNTQTEIVYRRFNLIFNLAKAARIKNMPSEKTATGAKERTKKLMPKMNMNIISGPNIEIAKR